MHSITSDCAAVIKERCVIFNQMCVCRPESYREDIATAEQVPEGEHMHSTCISFFTDRASIISH